MILDYLIPGIGAVLLAQQRNAEAAAKRCQEATSHSSKTERNKYAEDIRRKLEEEVNRVIRLSFGEESALHHIESNGFLDGKYAEFRVDALDVNMAISLEKDIQTRFIGSKEINLTEKLHDILRSRNQHDNNIHYYGLLAMHHIRLWAFLPYNRDFPETQLKSIADAMLDIVNEYNVRL